jgi:hypothetical protein
LRFFGVVDDVHPGTDFVIRRKAPDPVGETDSIVVRGDEFDCRMISAGNITVGVRR